MKKTITGLILLSLSSTSHADSDWIAPLLGGIILGNTFSSPAPRYNYNYYPTPTYIYTPPPVQYISPPPVYTYRQRGCGSYPVYDDYGHYVGQHHYCW